MQRLPACLPAGRNSGTHSVTNTQSLPRGTPDASSWSGSRLHRLPKASWQRKRAWQQTQRAFIGSPLLSRWLLGRLRGACSLPRATQGDTTDLPISRVNGDTTDLPINRVNGDTTDLPISRR